MVQVNYFIGLNKDGRKMIESILCDWCDWILEKAEKKTPMLRCYRNGLFDPIVVIKSTNVTNIQNVFDGSEE